MCGGDVCTQKSSGARGGGSTGLMTTDTQLFVIQLESMMFGQNRQPASEACFYDNQLVIKTASDLTGMCLLPLVCASPTQMHELYCH